MIPEKSQAFLRKSIGRALGVLLSLVCAERLARAQLTDKCIVNILNRTIQVSSDGGWSLPNVPSSQGRIRARATCVDADGKTRSGQSDYFTVVRNGITPVSKIVFQDLEAIPVSVQFSP